jgi:hypothetical protein
VDGLRGVGFNQVDNNAGAFPGEANYHCFPDSGART